VVGLAADWLLWLLKVGDLERDLEISSTFP
jgi:hypothetical protein